MFNNLVFTKKLFNYLAIFMFLFSSVSFAARECVSGDCENGRGAMIANGNKYEGEFKNGKAEGKGILIDTRGGKYEGEWKNDKPEGQGVLTGSDGVIYEGEFKNGNANGHITKTFADGDKYIGEFKDGETDYRGGTYITVNGDKYTGREQIIKLRTESISKSILQKN